MKATNNTTLSFGMVSIPVGVCKATEKSQPKLDRAGPSGAKVERKEFDSATGQVVTSDDVIRGLRVGDDFKAIPLETLQAIDQRSAQGGDTMEIVEFVDMGEVRMERVTGAYYLQSQPSAGNLKGYRLLYEALRRTGKAAGAVWTARVVQHPVVIYPHENGSLVMNTFAFADEWREPDAQVLAHLSVEVEDRQVDMAVQLVETLSGDGSLLEGLRDVRAAEYRELLSQAASGEPIVVPTEPVAESVASDDLTAALEASIAKTKPAPKKRAKAKAKA